ncbi:MAG: hypothetical protein DHS80DRAFT_11991 [Piptocephalis tieghemiana]|nr:MAG: hypothetical protein DHS80DRAFT_11991 [Piptocephalis tieghemiana]
MPNAHSSSHGSVSCPAPKLVSSASQGTAGQEHRKPLVPSVPHPSPIPSASTPLPRKDSIPLAQKAPPLISSSSLPQSVPTHTDPRSSMSSFGHANDLETVLQTLCELDSGTTLLLDRLKQNSYSARESAAFLRKRALLEEEYARGMMKLVVSADGEAAREEGKAGSWSESYRGFLRVHEAIALSRLKFANSITEIASSMTSLYKGNERSRKELKDMAQKFERHLSDAETSLDKARLKYEGTSEEWEKVILQKGAGEGAATMGGSIGGHGSNPGFSPSSPSFMPHGPSSNTGSTGTKRSNPLGGIFKQIKTPSQLSKMEEDARYKASQANESYKNQLHITNTARQDYYTYTLPKLLRALMECVSESDAGMQYLLAKYAFTYESAEFSEASTLIPKDGHGNSCLRWIVDQVDNPMDFSSFLAGYKAKARNHETSDIPYTEYAMVSGEGEWSSATAQSYVNPKPIFGIPLEDHLKRDQIQVPTILVKCAHAVEEHGIDSQGIYRMSGQTSKIKALKALFNRDSDLVDLTQGDWLLDINIVSGVLKLYFRELPEPLLTDHLYPQFIHAAVLPLDESREKLMALVKHLPRPNYTTAEYLFRHLQRISLNCEENKMTRKNIGIVFGPTLMVGRDQTDNPLADMGPRSRAVERMLEFIDDLFPSSAPF